MTLRGFAEQAHRTPRTHQESVPDSPHQVRREQAPEGSQHAATHTWTSEGIPPTTTTETTDPPAGPLDREAPVLHLGGNSSVGPYAADLSPRPMA